MSKKYFLYIAIVAAVLAFGVVMLGAYVRLSQAGLGCPDWPGCYGHVSVPAASEVNSTLLAARPLEPARAWKEMIHRYFVGALSALIFALAVMAVWRRQRPDQPKLLPALLAVLLILQALLGMWTVTLLLFPPVVTAHLLGGLATLSLLALLVLQSGGYLRLGAAATPRLRVFAALSLIVLVCQIALGGWVSSNYAAIACPDFPTCQGSLWPAMDFASGFSWHGLGPDYQGGILANPARMAIHMAHRLGALITFLVVGGTALWMLLKAPALRRVAAAVAMLLVLQVCLGISLVKFGWPLAIADLHNGVAALLLVSIVTLNWSVNAGKK
ncbi:MAG TPA: COX15/CtaA family protein [Gammaproteobacteria bacterium]|nr:COX15/CtaA family protein [Gammaproteobacteria bacterium]